MTKVYKIKGMDCPSCAAMLECDLEDAGIKGKCSYAKSELTIEGEHEPEKVKKIVRGSGYSLS